MHLDSIHLDQLHTLAEGDIHKKGTHLAHNAYNFFYGGTYFVPPYLPEETFDKRSNEDEPVMEQQSNTAKQESIVKPEIRLYPNPAQNQLTIEYANTSEAAHLYIVNMMGDIIETKALKGGSGRVDLNTTTYQNGVYLARIETSNSILLKDKFVIIK